MIEKILTFLAGGSGVAYTLTAVMLIGVALGGGLCKLYYDAQFAVLEASIARERQARAEQDAADASAALDRLQSAQRRGDELVTQLAAADAARTQLAQEKDREIARLTTGRACLGGDVVRLLNGVRDQESGIGYQLPAPSSLAFGADSAAAPDSGIRNQGAGDSTSGGFAAPKLLPPDTRHLSPGYASDTDLALWARHARDEHEACRRRIAALNNWLWDWGGSGGR